MDMTALAWSRHSVASALSSPFPRAVYPPGPGALHRAQGTDEVGPPPRVMALGVEMGLCTVCDAGDHCYSGSCQYRITSVGGVYHTILSIVEVVCL